MKKILFIQLNYIKDLAACSCCFLREDDTEIVKIHCQLLKILRNNRIAPKKHSWVMGIQILQMKDRCFFSKREVMIFFPLLKMLNYIFIALLKLVHRYRIVLFLR